MWYGEVIWKTLFIRVHSSHLVNDLLQLCRRERERERERVRERERERERERGERERERERERL